MNKESKTVLEQINRIRVKGNFQSIKREIGEERLKEFIYSVYPKFSITEIETITGIPDSTLERWFKELNIPSFRNHIINRAIPGDEDTEMIIIKGMRAQKISSVKITPELAYVIGFALGDGTVERFSFDVFNKDLKLKENLLKFLKPYGSITEKNRNDKLWTFRLSNVKIANLIKDENGIRQDTLDYIFSNDKLAKSFIAAFWDAEGTVRRQGNYFHIYLYNTNKILIDRIGIYLVDKTIKYSIHSRKSRDKNGIINGKKIVSRKILHRISIPKSSIQKWIGVIGNNLLHSKKSEVIKEIKQVYGGKQNE